MVHLISCACDGRPFHLHRYLDEAMFRYNNNGTKDNPLNRAVEIAGGIEIIERAVWSVRSGDGPIVTNRSRE